MFAVVGCRECSSLWIVEGRPDTTECPRCGRRHAFDRLRRLAEAEDARAAREARARLLAERSGHGEDFESPGPVDATGSVVSDEELLEAHGIDPGSAADAGERDRNRSSRRETVLEALRDLDEPTEEDVVTYASARGVPADYVERALAKLVEAGEASETGGRYRLL